MAPLPRRGGQQLFGVVAGGGDRRLAREHAGQLDDPLAVRAASHGHLLVEAAHARAVLGPPGGGTAMQYRVALTPREREILGHIWRGRTMKQTARQLGISARTVENLQGNLFRKLGGHSRSAALTTAIVLGLSVRGRPAC